METPRSAELPVSASPTPEVVGEEAESVVLTWRVHLRKRDPSRLPIVILTTLIAFLCVWLLFRMWLPAIVAVLLLIGATSEYLFPIAYRVNAEGVFADPLTGRFALRWKEARRCVVTRQGILLTPLSVPSRLDNYRGVFLRYAPPGKPGDRASLLAAIAHYAPHLLGEGVRR